MMMDEMILMNEEAKKENYWMRNYENLTEEHEKALAYIQENEVVHKKVKKDIPTVIEYQGRRYVLDHADHRKG